MQILIEFLERLGMALLGSFFATATQTAQDTGIDSTALQFISETVSQAETDPTLTDGDSRYNAVFTKVVQYLSDRGIDTSIAFVESIIGLAVHHNHVTTGAAGQTVSSVIAQGSAAAPSSSPAKP